MLLNYKIYKNILLNNLKIKVTIINYILKLTKTKVILTTKTKQGEKLCFLYQRTKHNFVRSILIKIKMELFATCLLNKKNL